MDWMLAWLEGVRGAIGCGGADDRKTRRDETIKGLFGVPDTTQPPWFCIVTLTFTVYCGRGALAAAG